MTRESSGKGRKTGPVSRDDRLKAALRDNLQKRKAQARRRGDAKKAPAADKNED